ncbi:ATP-binding protein [Longispora sp. NPDC051575]|uniref:ATP-binding protein n=1 Tax=Longispora sp. NPDC051575 TaxID=3154943 RepID=UPI003432F539
MTNSEAEAVPAFRFPDHVQDLLGRDPTASERFDVGEFRRQQARQYCDTKFPKMFVHAAVDIPDVARWVEGFRSGEPRSLLLLGVTGAGKTHAAFGALRAAVTQPVAVRWEATTAADLYADLRPRSGTDSEAILERYRRADLLLLDDLGAARPTEWVEEMTYRLLNDRYAEQRPVIITTNLPLVDFKARLGDRITSRLAEMCTRVVLTGPDRRRQNPAQ